MVKTGMVLLCDEADVYLAKQLKSVNVDYIGIHPAGGIKSRENLNKTIEYINTPAYQEFANIIRKSGKLIEFEGHVHSLLFPNDLFYEHPDWFRKNINGKRTADYNMCVSNKDALFFLEERAAELATILVPDTDNYLWWNDDVDGDCYCHCPDCKGLSPSDQYMIWCNTVLSGIQRINSSAKLCYLAYLATIHVPQKIKPIEGIFLEYAPIKRNSFIHINDNNCEDNKMETRDLPELLSYFGTKDSRVLEYWLDNSRFSNWEKPFKKLQFDTEIIKRDVDFYQSLNFEVITSFACWIGKEYQAEYKQPDFESYLKSLAS